MIAPKTASFVYSSPPPSRTFQSHFYIICTEWQCMSESLCYSLDTKLIYVTNSRLSFLHFSQSRSRKTNSDRQWIVQEGKERIKGKGMSPLRRVLELFQVCHLPLIHWRLLQRERLLQLCLSNGARILNFPMPSTLYPRPASTCTR